MTKLRAAIVAGIVGAAVGAAALGVSLSGGRPGPDRVHVLSPAGASGSTSTVAPTTTVPVTTTAPATTVAHTPTTVRTTTTTVGGPVQLGSPAPGVIYTIGGTCHLNRSAMTATCTVTVTASDGSTPAGQISVGTPSPYLEAQLSNGAATVTTPWDGNASHASVGYRGGLGKSADAYIPFS